MQTPFSRSVVLLVALAVLACQAREETDSEVNASDQVQANDAVAAGIAGTWNMRTLNVAGDSVLVTYDVVATDSQSGWTLTFPGREPIPVQVLSVTADSVIIDAGPYASALREGVTVSTRFEMERQGDRLSGLITALYNMPEGESTVPLRVEGTRAR